MAFVLLSSIAVTLSVFVAMLLLKDELLRKRSRSILIIALCIIAVIYNIYSAIPQIDIILNYITGDNFIYNISHRMKEAIIERHITSLSVPSVSILNSVVVVCDALRSHIKE